MPQLHRGESAEAEDPRHQHGEGRGVVLLWGLLTLAVALLAALVPIWFSPRFYFAGDTQSGAFGVWYHLGEELRAGRWPLMDPSYWGAGNFVVEGQWGLWNPLILLMGWWAAGVQNAVTFSTVVKVVSLVLGAGGSFLLLRSFGTRAPLAALGGLATTLTGFTVYMDAASWVTGLFVWALWPYAWWGLRRTAYAGRNPFPALLAGYLLVSIGYVHGTLLLAVTIGAVIIEALVARRWRSALVATGLGVLTGLVAAMVHLPSVLSVGPTSRRQGVVPPGTLGTNGGDFLQAALPFGPRGIDVFGHYPADAPLTYIAWFLPLLFLVRWSRVRRRPAEFVAVWVIVAASLVFILAPVVGPIRFPMRVTPYLATCVVLVAVVALDRGLVARPSLKRGVLAVAAAGVPSYPMLALRPEHWRIALAAALLVGSLTALVWVWLRFGGVRGPLAFGAGRFGAVAMLASLGVAVVQHHYVPFSDLAELRLPANLRYYERLLPDAEGDVIVVGSSNLPPKLRESSASNAELWSGFALANSWYLTGEPVVNMYTPVNYKAYKRAFCLSYNGLMCSDALKKLFNHPSELDVPRADLMSVSTIVIAKAGVPEDLRDDVPDGWRVVDESDRRVVWRRQDPLPSAGGPTYLSPGVEISDVRNEDMRLTFRVDAVPSGGGEIVLSRLPWPGYSVDNASFASPVNDFLVTLDVPEDSEGEVVTVEYAPPRWGLSVALGIFSVAVSLLLSAAHVLRRVLRRRRPDEPAAWNERDEEPVDRPAAASAAQTADER